MAAKSEGEKTAIYNKYIPLFRKAYADAQEQVENTLLQALQLVKPLGSLFIPYIEGYQNKSYPEITHVDDAYKDIETFRSIFPTGTTITGYEILASPPQREGAESTNESPFLPDQLSVYNSEALPSYSKTYTMAEIQKRPKSRLVRVR